MPLLFAYGINRYSPDVTHIMPIFCCLYQVTGKSAFDQTFAPKHDMKCFFQVEPVFVAVSDFET